LYEFLTDEEPIPIFHDLGNGLIVGQANSAKIDNARGTYGYMILTRKGSEVFSTCCNATRCLPTCWRRIAWTCALNKIPVRSIA
jgi:hypothetical protein